jgi:hypothetical protein
MIGRVSTRFNGLLSPELSGPEPSRPVLVAHTGGRSIFKSARFSYRSRHCAHQLMPIY